MKKILLVVVIFASGLFLSGCTAKPSETPSATVTKTGTVTMKSGEEWLLNTDGGIVNMTSNKVNLDNYLKKKVSVTGQFSGSTLYVDKID